MPADHTVSLVTFSTGAQTAATLNDSEKSGVRECKARYDCILDIEYSIYLAFSILDSDYSLLAPASCAVKKSKPVHS